MATWSQSHFLQSVGWAILNSFWQMAFLWCLFAGANYVLKPGAAKKYRAAVLTLFFGFGWFIATAISYYQNPSSTYTLLENSIIYTNSLLQICLLSASISYLVLLLFPLLQLFKNWQFIQFIKTEGLSKAAPEYRVFVSKIACHLGIQKKVKLAVSRFVSSPLTIGYLKPLILIPVAAFNNLTVAQIEAILLHELAHIRRYDYLLNLIVSIVHTLFYFNPFAKLFVRVIETERETCCDELVLQFGYDNVGYASALLHLEKTASHHPALALGAAGKKNLLTRIEKIVGMEKKKTFRLVQMVPLFAALVCILLFNSILIIKDAGKGSKIPYAYETVFMPWQLNNFQSPKNKILEEKTLPKQAQNLVAVVPNQMKIEIFNSGTEKEIANCETKTQTDSHFKTVNFDDIDGTLSKEEKDNVSNSVEATKKMMRTTQWKEIETSIAEVLNKKEKAVVKQEYLQELEKVNWNNVEQNLKANYDRLDWNAINENVTQAMASVKLDSLQTVFSLALKELNKAEKEQKIKTKIAIAPIPDASLTTLKIARETLCKNLDSIKSLRPKKIVRL